MINYLSIVFFVLSILAIVFYVYFNRSNLEIRGSIITIAVFLICSVFYYLDVYFNSFTNNYLFFATISAFLICVLFLLLNIVNLVNLKAHFLIFSLYAALVTTQSVVLGFHAINAYKISGVNWVFIIFSVIYFGKALLELLLVSPLFKFSFLMDVSTGDGTMKRPAFIRLAFYEWLYLLLFIVNNFLLLIVKSL